MIPKVLTSKKVTPSAFAPTLTPNIIVIILIIAFCAVSESLWTTPDSLNKLPSINIPNNGATEGNNNEQKSTTAIGNTTFSTFDTFLKLVIFTERSFFVVNALIIGGWINGINAIYE